VKVVTPRIHNVHICIYRCHINNEILGDGATCTSEHYFMLGSLEMNFLAHAKYHLGRTCLFALIDIGYKKYVVARSDIRKVKKFHVAETSPCRTEILVKA